MVRPVQLSAAAPHAKARRSETTTLRLIEVARRLFAERGFAHTALENIVAAACVTRGALYHHFAGKEALFEVIFLRLQAAIGERIEAAAAPLSGDLPGEIMAGCRAFLAAACEPDVRQIVLRDAPSVLGIEAWRLADERNATFRLRRALVALDRERGDATFDVEIVTVMLNGALNEAALWIARADDPAAALARAEQGFALLMPALSRGSDVRAR